MKRLSWLVVLLMAMVAMPLAQEVVSPPGAAACSCGSECDQLMQRSDVVLAGRIVAWRAVDYPYHFESFQPIEVQVEVREVYKGRTGASVALVDASSLDAYTFPNELHWYGASGACGSFDEDPLGKYIIAGANYDDTGALRMGRLQTLFLDDEASGAWYDEVRGRLAAEFPGAPYAGSGLERSSGGFDLVAAGALLVAFGAAGVAVVERRGRATRVL